MLFILIFLLLLHISLLLFFTVWLLFEKRIKTVRLSNFPFISILLAARNEEQNIARCLSALAHLDYPSDRFEVLIGNDGSQDKTAEIAGEYCQKDPHFRL